MNEALHLCLIEDRCGPNPPLYADLLGDDSLRISSLHTGQTRPKLPHISLHTSSLNEAILPFLEGQKVPGSQKIDRLRNGTVDAHPVITGLMWLTGEMTVRDRLPLR